MTDQLVDERTDLDTYESSDRGLGLLMLIGGAIGLLSASILIVEKVNFLQDKADGKSPILGCDINPIIGCGNVINTDQASVFGFPNPLMGVAGFAIVATLGVLLVARVTFPAFVWLGLQAGAIFGIGLVSWLQYQSIYNLNALCPYCMVVWSIMIPLFVWITARNLRAFAPDNAVSRFVGDWTLLINLLWYVVLITLIYAKFGSALWA